MYPAAGGYQQVHNFPMDINPKVNSFSVSRAGTHYDVAVKHFSHYLTGTNTWYLESLNVIWCYALRIILDFLVHNPIWWKLLLTSLKWSKVFYNGNYPGIYLFSQIPTVEFYFKKCSYSLQRYLFFFLKKSTYLEIFKEDP